jgi:hypothetical protein
MAGLKWRALVGIVVGGVGAFASAAENGPGPMTRPVSAVLEARRVEVQGERYCLGTDGLYRFAHETYEGTSTGDDEVTGRFVLTIHAFDNVSQGFQGLATGKAKIYDAATGRLKAVADVHAIDSPSADPPGVRVDGFVNGRIFRDAGTAAAGAEPQVSVFFANFSVRLDLTASFVGNLGGDAPVRPYNAALVQDTGGSCASVDVPW